MTAGCNGSREERQPKRRRCKGSKERKVKLKYWKLQSTGKSNHADMALILFVVDSERDCVIASCQASYLLRRIHNARHPLRSSILIRVRHYDSWMSRSLYTCRRSHARIATRGCVAKSVSKEDLSLIQSVQ